MILIPTTTMRTMKFYFHSSIHTWGHFGHTIVKFAQMCHCAILRFQFKTVGCTESLEKSVTGSIQRYTGDVLSYIDTIYMSAILIHQPRFYQVRRNILLRHPDVPLKGKAIKLKYEFYKIKLESIYILKLYIILTDAKNQIQV